MGGKKGLKASNYCRSVLQGWGDAAGSVFSVVFYCPVQGSGVSIGARLGPGTEQGVRPHWNINPSSCQDWPASNKACRVVKYSGFLFTMCWRAEGWPRVRLHTLPCLGLPTQQSSHGAGDCFSHLSQCKLDPTGSFVKIHCKLNKGCWKPKPLLLGKKIAFPGKLDFANLWALHWESPLATHRPAKLNLNANYCMLITLFSNIHC